MRSSEPRQLKELRNLMPWTWDTQVDNHPPGAAAMRDFQVCDFQSWSSGTPRRGPKTPASTPSAATSRKRPPVDSGTHSRKSTPRETQEETNRASKPISSTARQQASQERASIAEHAQACSTAKKGPRSAGHTQKRAKLPPSEILITPSASGPSTTRRYSECAALQAVPLPTPGQGVGNVDSAPLLCASSPAVPAMERFSTPATAPRSRLALSATPAPTSQPAATREAASSEPSPPATLSASPAGAAAPDERLSREPHAAAEEPCAECPGPLGACIAASPIAVGKQLPASIPSGQVHIGASLPEEGDSLPISGEGFAVTLPEQGSEDATLTAAKRAAEGQPVSGSKISGNLASKLKMLERSRETETASPGSPVTFGRQAVVLEQAQSNPQRHTSSANPTEETTLIPTALPERKLAFTEGARAHTGEEDEVPGKTQSKLGVKHRRSVMDVLVDSRLQPGIRHAQRFRGQAGHTMSRSQSPEEGAQSFDTQGGLSLSRSQSPEGGEQLRVESAAGSGSRPAHVVEGGSIAAGIQAAALSLPRFGEPGSGANTGNQALPIAACESTSGFTLAAAAPENALPISSAAAHVRPAAGAGLSALLFSKPSPHLPAQHGDAQRAHSAAPRRKAPCIGIRMDTLLSLPGQPQPARSAAACQAVTTGSAGASTLLEAAPPEGALSNEMHTRADDSLQEDLSRACELLPGGETSQGTLFAPVAVRPETTAALRACQKSLQSLFGRIHSGLQVPLSGLACSSPTLPDTPPLELPMQPTGQEGADTIWTHGASAPLPAPRSLPLLPPSHSAALGLPLQQRGAWGESPLTWALQPLPVPPIASGASLAPSVNARRTSSARDMPPLFCHQSDAPQRRRGRPPTKALSKHLTLENEEEHSASENDFLEEAYHGSFKSQGRRRKQRRRALEQEETQEQRRSERLARALPADPIRLKLRRFASPQQARDPSHSYARVRSADILDGSNRAKRLTALGAAPGLRTTVLAIDGSVGSANARLDKGLARFTLADGLKELFRQAGMKPCKADLLSSQLQRLRTSRGAVKVSLSPNAIHDLGGVSTRHQVAMQPRREPDPDALPALRPGQAARLIRGVELLELLQEFHGGDTIEELYQREFCHRGT